jgi:hypothetical protein
LKKMDLYKNLPSDDIKSIAAAMENVTFGRGECIIEQGQPGGAMFVISTGTCGMFDLVNRVRCVFLVLPLIRDLKLFLQNTLSVWKVTGPTMLLSNLGISLVTKS